MRIQSISISNFRVLDEVSLTPSPGINLIWGDNGAGKTSILEALYLAARGRSFRHQDAGPFIRNGANKARVIIKMLDDTDRAHTLGIERAAREQVVRLDGENLQRRSDQVRALPLQILTPNSHALIEGPPELRRRYLDLALFHVEHAYHRWYSDYQRALRQRNAALRTQPKTARTWDPSLAEFAVLLHKAREDYISRLAAVAEGALGRMAPGIQVELSHRPGWDPQIDLVEQLANRFELDCRQGFTGIGPHRADILIRAEQSDAAKRLSRGQQKLVVTALMFGQTTLQKTLVGQSPVLLLDDLPAELDRTHRERVTAELQSLNVQALITSVDPDSLPMVADMGLFHVEQGGRLVG